MIVDTIKFVYFDVGGVLVKDNDDGWEILLNDLGLDKNKKQDLMDLFEVIEKDFDVGKRTKEFPLIIENQFGIKLPKKYPLVKELVNMFLYRNEGIWEIINVVKKKYKVGLLTNMYDGMLYLIRRKELIPEINWDVIVDSSVEKCRKPERKIYEIAESKSGFKGNEILFIDNKKENLEIPKKNGWQTYWYDSSDYDKSNQELAKILR